MDHGLPGDLPSLPVPWAVQRMLLRPSMTLVAGAGALAPPAAAAGAGSAAGGLHYGGVDVLGVTRKQLTHLEKQGCKARSTLNNQNSNTFKNIILWTIFKQNLATSSH